MGKHLRKPILSDPQTLHPPQISHSRRRRNQEGALRKQKQPHIPEPRIPQVALVAIMIQGSCNPRRNFSKPVCTIKQKLKSVLHGQNIIYYSASSKLTRSIRQTGLGHLVDVLSTLQNVIENVSLNTDQVIAKRKCKISANILVDSSKMWWMDTNMSDISN